MSDVPQQQGPVVNTDGPRCDHICLLDDEHVERGIAHQYGYELPSPRSAFEALGVAVLRFMAEDHVDWRDIHAEEIARLLGVEPGEEAFTWRWADRLAEVRS